MPSIFDNLKRSISVLFKPAETIEMRCVGDRTLNGYYRYVDKLAQDAYALNHDINPKQNVYVCLNPVLPELFPRRADSYGVTGRGGCVKDSQVVCRRWLLVDIDPVRPSGTSATEAQKQAASTLAENVYAWLSERLGKDCLIFADSGNGSHILIRLDDIPVDAQSRWVCEKFLKMLSDRFSMEEAKVDKKTFNAARICTLYGTHKRKGSNTEENPHRPSKLVHVPNPLTPVDWETLASMVEPFHGKPRIVQPPVDNGQVWDIPPLLEQHGLKHTCDDQYQTSSGELATRWVLEVCPWNADHNDNAAWIVQWPNGAVAAGCQHDGCSGKDWQELKRQWNIPVTNGISAADIVFSNPKGSSISFASSESYQAPPPPKLLPISSSTSFDSLECYIDPQLCVDIFWQCPGA
jgi:hypothetical protein